MSLPALFKPPGSSIRIDDHEPCRVRWNLSVPWHRAGERQQPRHEILDCSLCKAALAASSSTCLENLLVFSPVRGSLTAILIIYLGPPRGRSQ